MSHPRIRTSARRSATASAFRSERARLAPNLAEPDGHDAAPLVEPIYRGKAIGRGKLGQLLRLALPAAALANPLARGGGAIGVLQDRLGCRRRFGGQRRRGGGQGNRNWKEESHDILPSRE